MFIKTKTVVVLTIYRDKIIVAKISLGRPPKIISKFGADWNEDNLITILTAVKEKLKTDRLRLLLSQEASYVVKTEIDAVWDDDSQRSAVLEKITGQIPEELKADDWDYKVIAQHKDKQEIVAFAPVRQLFAAVSLAMKEVGLKVEAIEPEEIALERDSDPLIGLALKTDLKGKDSQVLNLKLNQETDQVKIDK